MVCLALILVANEADAVSVQLSADRTQVRTGDSFTVTVAISIDDGSSQPEPELYLPDGFELVGSRSSSSTSISIVNGAVTQEKTVNVVSTIRGNTEGTFTIGPAAVKAAGKTLRSNAIGIQVVKGLAQPRTSSAPQSQESVTADQLEEIQENLFIATTSDRKSVYVGEQILLTYDLYSQYRRIQNPRFGAIPSYTGFWAEKVFDANRLEQRSEVVNGRPYNKSRLKQVALFPTLPGTRKLEQLEFICDLPIRSRRRSLFDMDEFFSWDPFRSHQVTVRAADIEIDVRPLPSGSPTSFSGGVGTFTVRADVSSEKAAQGDPVTVTVTVEGRGNLHGVGEPPRPDPERFKFYDPNVTVEATIQNTVLTGSKTFEYVAIPETSGRVDLPSFELTYFDPRQAKYVTLQTDPIPLEVAPAARVEEVAMTATPGGSAVKVLGEDIRFIKADASSLSDHANYLHASGLFWSFNALPVLCLIAAWQWRRRQAMLDGDLAYARRHRSRGEARKRLAEAKQLMATDGASFYSEVYRAMSSFLADRLNLDASELTTNQARQALASASVPSDLTNKVVGVFEACDFARFASGAQTATDREDILSQTEDLIGELERAL
ncbi:MAG: hypothetical protein CME21_09240 [Gemmatimonadetes bacterium]|nr:hypothetical protein [Gemmatimonadota bacterium]